MHGGGGVSACPIKSQIRRKNQESQVSVHKNLIEGSSSSVVYFRHVNTIKNTIRGKKYNAVQEKRQQNDQCYGMQVGEKELKKTRVSLVVTSRNKT